MNWNGYFYKKYGAGIYLLLGPLLFDVFYVFFSPLWYESKKNNTATIIEMKTIVSTSKNLDTSCYKIFEALKPLRDLKSTYRSHRTDQLELYRRWKKISKAELEELLPIYIETDHFWKALYRSIDQAFQAMDDDKPYILVIPGSSIGESDNEVVEMINQKVLHSETSMVQAIDLNEVKSGLWLLSHYANRLSRAPDQILTPCQACDFLKSNPNHQVLMVDDCEYSGQQLSSSIRYMNGGEDVNNNVLDIYVALAFRRKKEGTMPNVHMFYEELPSRDIILPHKTPDSMSNSSDITCGHYDSKFTDEITTKYNKGHPFWFEEIYRECEFYSLPTWAKPYDRYFLGDQSDLPYFSEDRQMSHESQYIDFIYWFSLNKNNEQLMKIMDRFLVAFNTETKSSFARKEDIIISICHVIS